VVEGDGTIENVSIELIVVEGDGTIENVPIELIVAIEGEGASLPEGTEAVADTDPELEANPETDP
jgi:hypothetical protein